MDTSQNCRFGRYEILDEIGRGAMGVYRAEIKINRTIKTISIAAIRRGSQNIASAGAKRKPWTTVPFRHRHNF
jgi:hypothetical protein